MADAASAISRLTTSDRVADEVRRRIWTGELPSGQRLHQDDLAALLGVSRIPVREALIALAHEGVVRMTPHRGAFVESLSEVAVRDHYEIYAHIDCFALRKVVERATAEELRELAEALRVSADIDDAEALQDHIVATRARIHELGGSPRFAAVARGLEGIVPGNFFAEIPGSAEIARTGLHDVGDALARADADNAVTAYTSMLVAQGERVLDQLRARGVLSPPSEPSTPERTS